MVVRWISLTGLITAIALVTSPAVGRDLDGRYKDSPLHDWFERLASGKGLCCSFADGYVVEDADWQTTADGKHYRVRVPLSAGSIQMNWVDVPDEAVITEPNRAGRTMVLAAVWLWRRVNPLFYAGQHDLTIERYSRSRRGWPGQARP